MPELTKEEILIAEKIKAIRKHKNLTQKQFAQRINLDISTYSYLECQKANFDLETIKLISNLFHINFLSILDDDIDLNTFINIIKA